MDLKKLNRLKRQLDSLRSASANITTRKMVGLARSLGRNRSKKQTGEPMYVSDIFQQSRPIPIPSHPGALKKGTALKILDQLEGDIFQWEEFFHPKEIQAKKPEKGATDEENGQ